MTAEKMAESIAKLVNAGFEIKIHEDGTSPTYERCSGSISNWSKTVVSHIHEVNKYCYGNSDEKVVIAYVRHEDESESGEWFADHHSLIECYHTIDDIVSKYGKRDISAMMKARKECHIPAPQVNGNESEQYFVGYVTSI